MTIRRLKLILRTLFCRHEWYDSTIAGDGSVIECKKCGVMKLYRKP